MGRAFPGLKIIDFVFAARPMLHLPVWTIFLITFHYCRPLKVFSFEAYIALAGVTLLMAGTYYLNQIFDYEGDLINRKLGFLQKGLITKKEMMTALLAAGLISMIAALIAGFVTLSFFVPCILLGILYSVPPLRLKDRPIWGGLANGIGYGLLLPCLVPGYFDRIEVSRLYINIYFFITILATYLLTIIPDRAGDIESGKKTLATKYSIRTIILMGMICLAISLIPAILSGQEYLTAISLISIILYGIGLAGQMMPAILLACKAPIMLLALLAGYYFPTYLAFIIVLIVLTKLYYRLRFGIKYPRLT